jgi:hypothetical protein
MVTLPGLVIGAHAIALRVLPFRLVRLLALGRGDAVAGGVLAPPAEGLGGGLGLTVVALVVEAGGVVVVVVVGDALGEVVLVGEALVGRGLVGAWWDRRSAHTRWSG